MFRAIAIVLAGLVALALAGVVAVALISSIQPMHLGYRDDRPVGIYRMRLVTYEITEYSRDSGGVVVHDELGGPVAAYRFLRSGDVRR